MAWFYDTSGIKTFVGKELDASTEIAGLDALIATAEERYYFSRNLYPTFWADVNVSLAGDPKLAAAKELYKRSLAWFVLLLFSETGVRNDENGIARVESTERKAAFKYQEVNARKVYEQRGFEALDAFYVYLEATDISTWGQLPESEEYAPVRNSMIKSAVQFAKAANRTVDRRTFESMSGLMRDIEDSMMRQFLPKQYRDFLYGAIIDDLLTTPDNGFVPYLRKAIAACTLKLAAEQNAISFDGARVFLVETYTDGALESQKFDANTVSTHRVFQEVQQNAFLNKARAYARDNKAQMPLLWSTADDGDNTDADAWATPSSSDIDAEAKSNADRKILIF